MSPPRCNPVYPLTFHIMQQNWIKLKIILSNYLTILHSFVQISPCFRVMLINFDRHIFPLVFPMENFRTRSEKSNNITVIHVYWHYMNKTKIPRTVWFYKPSPFP